MNLLKQQAALEAFNKKAFKDYTQQQIIRPVPILKEETELTQDVELTIAKANLKTLTNDNIIINSAMAYLKETNQVNLFNKWYSIFAKSYTTRLKNIDDFKAKWQRFAAKIPELGLLPAEDILKKLDIIDMSLSTMGSAFEDYNFDAADIPNTIALTHMSKDELLNEFKKELEKKGIDTSKDFQIQFPSVKRDELAKTIYTFNNKLEIIKPIYLGTFILEDNIIRYILKSQNPKISFHKPDDYKWIKSSKEVIKSTSSTTGEGVQRTTGGVQRTTGEGFKKKILGRYKSH